MGPRQKHRQPGLTKSMTDDPFVQYVQELQEAVASLRDRVYELEKDKLEERAKLDPFNVWSPLSFRKPAFTDQLTDLVDESQLAEESRKLKNLRRDFELHKHDDESTLDAYFFKVDKYSDTQLRVSNTPIRIGKNLYNNYGIQTLWDLTDGYDGGVLHTVPLDSLGTYFFMLEVAFSSGFSYSLRFKLIHEFYDYDTETVIRPNTNDSIIEGNTIYRDYEESDGAGGTFPVRYWREFIGRYTIVYDAVTDENKLGSVEQIWPGHMMSVNDRVV